MPFSLTFQKFEPRAPNLLNIVFDDVVMKLIDSPKRLIQ